MHNWDDFRIFLSVAKTGSYSGSARELGVNHSTISRRIHSLEQQHKVKLFERVQQGYQLTDAGKSIFDIVEQANDATIHASRVLSGFDQQLSGEIKLTMPHEIFDRFLGQPLSKFTNDYPEIELNMAVKHGLKNIANREADLAVRLTPNPPDYLIGKRVTYMQHGLYANLQMQAKINAGETVPLVLWPHMKAEPSWARDHFKQTRVGVFVDDLASMHEAVRVGMGVARMPCFYPDSILSPDVVRLPIDQPLSDWGVWLLNHVDLRNSARINECKKVIWSHLEQQIPIFLGQCSRWG